MAELSLNEAVRSWLVLPLQKIVMTTGYFSRLSRSQGTPLVCQSSLPPPPILPLVRPQLKLPLAS